VHLPKTKKMILGN